MGETDSLLTCGDLFAGVGGLSLGTERAGFKTAWHVEIDTKCRDVLRFHYPDSLILEDVRECGAQNLPPVDVIVFGSPCQDLSVAGLRLGIKGERSGLFFEAARIVGELRPAFAVWENVPGALSSNNGLDFAAVLDSLADNGAMDIGWTVLDSQWFGVAQSRRRVFVVADFRGQRASEVLALPEGLQGNPPPSRSEGKETSRSFSSSSFGGFKEGVGTLRRSKGDIGSGGSEILVIQNGSRGRDYSEGFGIVEGRPMYTLDTFAEHAIFTPSYGIRRLTPLESERLMSWPDYWTRWGASGNEMSDLARYNMVGNGAVSNVMQWIAERMRSVM